VEEHLPDVLVAPEGADEDERAVPEYEAERVDVVVLLFGRPARL
jgi:hypothetical protein